MPPVERLVYARNTPGLRRLVRELLSLFGIEFPRSAQVAPGLRLPHRAFGLVVHSTARIGADVTIYQGVTIGRANPWEPSTLDAVVIEDGVTLCAGAKVLGSTGVLTVGTGSVVGANAVLTRSTGPRELWAGIPARKIRDLA